ncbi:MAG TPA: acetyl-CoA carboxylase biotin carboxylase subunit [Polyangia bacterium]|jgi:acetyl-CoA carboxylase biotin carboxylase subunit|nr:acetyl-CoA carboxylase biotin carboxylase subunit [Polyangia bacterium]
MYKKVLIANRGEIALRVIRACREMGLRSVAVHSVADAESLHVRFADEKVCIGPASARLSYLSIPAIISAAEVSGADAVHPGYGFLSENAHFAEVVQRCGLHWIGPQPEVMRLMGDKVSARKAMAAAGVPILPGTGVIEDDADAERAIERIGLPVIIKASAGGGGRGMKIVEDRGRLGAQLAAARSEAQAGFGNPDVYLERYIGRPRHVEVQVLGDGSRAIALGERECSIQRRHQKLVEEAPSVALDDVRRGELLAIARKATQSLGYKTVGTLEFLLDEDKNFYFMEMNTRIQVEHTVTEEVFGVDLVREQMRLAAGDPLKLPADIRPRGHAIEVRINAEDPVTFAPSPGRITAVNFPGGLGVRIDTHIYANYEVPSHYDSLLAKLIVRAENRRAALARLRRALAEFVIEGCKTNLDFHRRLLANADFVAGRMDTHLIERM